MNAENTLLAAGETESPEHGNQVTLADAERRVTSFLTVLRIHGAGPATFDLQVRFYRNDGPDGRPGTLLWESPLLARIIDSGAPIGYVVPVPDVIVPDAFTWTVQITSRAGNMARMGPSEYHPPATGSAPFGFWRRTGGPEGWEFTGLEEAPFGARVEAEAAPAALDDGSSAPPEPSRIAVRPNPVRARAEFVLDPGESPAVILIHDVHGRLVDRLDARSGRALWIPSADAPGGVYFARLAGMDAPAPVAFVLLR